MEITDETIEKIENIFCFPLYDWQKEYLKDRTHFPSFYGRRNGKTFAYILELLLCEENKIKKEDIEKYADGYYPEAQTEKVCNGRYKQWFARECLKINQKLVENGFETIII